jgi:hypothetical protein
MWIDAVCIDQSNIAERGQTVEFMGDIYASALGGVVVWLGEEGPDTHLVDSFLTRLIDGSARHDAAERKWIHRLLRKQRSFTSRDGPLLSDPGWQALYNLLLTPWSSRVWIVQEIALAPREPEIRVLRGTYEFTMERIALAMSPIYKHNLQQEVGIRYPARFAKLWGERIARKDKLTMLDVVIRNWLTYASDPRDKIYGLGGMAEDIKIKPVYEADKSADSVYTDFAHRVIEKYRDLSILGALSSIPAERNHRDPRTYRSSNLPSWVPDWRVWEPHTFVMIPERDSYPDADGRSLAHFMAAGPASSQCDQELLGKDVSQQLQLRGQVIDTIGGFLGPGPVYKMAGSVDDALEFLRRSEFVADVNKEYTVIGSDQGNYGDAIVKIAASNLYPHTGETLLEAFYAALTMDDLHHRHEAHRLDSSARLRRWRLRKIYFEYHKLTHMLRDSDMGLFHQPSLMLPKYNMGLLDASMGHYVTQAMSVCVNRRMIKTSTKGYIGIFTTKSTTAIQLCCWKVRESPSS